jgi:thioredoxin reductase (NADPH)
MAIWEPVVQNYLGFPESIAGTALLERGRIQATRFGAELVHDEIIEARAIGSVSDGRPDEARFRLTGRASRYRAKRLLLATGLTHLPPEIPGVRACLGKSLFFCKDCDAFRAQGGRVVIIGRNNEAVEYALAMLRFSSAVSIALNGKRAQWAARHQGWLTEYGIPVHPDPIVEVEHEDGQLLMLGFKSGQRLAADFVFTTRGDVYHTDLAELLGAELSHDGEIVVDGHMKTSVPGLYAAGCVTPANCQMIIAAGQGATAAQAINRDLFEESLATGTLLGNQRTQSSLVNRES